MRRIATIGFMGAGKTTVSKLIAAELGWQFLDLDEEIERVGERSISQLFAQGEAHFRALERLVLAEVLKREPLVLATGGGVVEEPENLSRLLESATVVYLQVPLEVLWERLAGEEGSGVRPLLAGGFAEFASRFALRERSYNRAHFTVDGVVDPQTLAQKIIAVWRDGSEHNQTKPGGE